VTSYHQSQLRFCCSHLSGQQMVLVRAAVSVQTELAASDGKRVGMKVKVERHKAGQEKGQVRDGLLGVCGFSMLC